MIVLLGKSGSGKDFVQEALVRLGVPKIVLYTTRPKRKREIDGVSYHFIDNTQFIRKLEADEFAVWNMYIVASGDHWCYGILKEDLHKFGCVQINSYWISDIRSYTMFQPLLFYLNTTQDTLVRRLQRRGGDMAEAERRMSADVKDFKQVAELSDFVLSSDSGLSAKNIAGFISQIHDKLVK